EDLNTSKQSLAVTVRKQGSAFLFTTQPDSPPFRPWSLPPRPGGHRAPPKPPPSHQRDAESDEDYVEPTSDDVYDDCNNEQESFPAPPEDFYDDISNQQPPPMVGRGALPPPPAQNLEPEATYDDFDEQPALPERPPLSKPPPPPPVRESTPPLPPDSIFPESCANDEACLMVNSETGLRKVLDIVDQETYDDLDNAPGPVVQHIPRKLPNLPPPPPGKASNPPKEPSDSEESEEFENEVDEIQENVYEVTDDSSKSGGGSVSAPSPPPLPPGRTAEARPPKPKPTPPAGTGPKSPAGGAFPVIDATQIQGLKSKLRKVSLDNVEHSPPSAHEPKVYGETGSVSEKLKKFQQKAGDGRPGVALKPVMAKKPNVPAKDSGKSPISNVSNSKPNSLPATPPREKSPTPSAPDVIVIPKKPPQHTNMPLPPLPKETPPPKAPEPVAEYPEEIYDDACSGDTLHQYDWFHGDIDRKSTEAKIHALNKDGTFLVRTSKNDPRFPYTLVVLHEGRINNLRIRERTDGRYALGDEKSDELAFNDVLAMINHHKKNHVVLLGRQHATVVLQQTPPKR
ncbi:hypothetical protein BaRGS_00010348, partial [Batillaria attramentaria]